MSNVSVLAMNKPLSIKNQRLIEIFEEIKNRKIAYTIKNKYTQEDFAKDIKSTQSHISKVFNGTKPIGDVVEEKVLRLLDINKNWWETGEGQMFNKNAEFGHKPHFYKDRKSMRLVELRQALNLPPEVMSEKLGMSLQEYKEAEAGKTPFTNQFTALIAYAFNISKLWWEHGEDDMFQPTGEVDLELVDIDEFETVFLPIAPVNVEGTFGEMSDPESNYGSYNKVKVVVPKGTNVDRNIVFKLRGNSMAPVYPEGTLVRCKKVHRGDWEYLSPGVYAVSYNNSFVFKRIKDNEILSKRYLTLHSDNPMVPGSITVPLDQIRHIWEKLSVNYSEPD